MKLPAISSMYYVAILCPPEVDAKVLRFKQQMKEQYGCVVALKSPAHITVIAPFWFEEAKEMDLRQALQSLTAPQGELVIELKGFSHFGKRVLFIQVEENPDLEKCQLETENHFLESLGSSIKKEERPFHPHITIANRDLKPSGFEKAWSYFSNKDFAERFLTKTISLLKLIDGRWKPIDSNTG